MKFYLAPMEGITGYVYRNAYNKHFHNIDKYFTPFIVPNKTKKLKSKEINDISVENNKDLNVVPQILSNNSEQSILVIKKLQELGYKEVNFNFGCPSSTVVSKGKGAGILKDLESLDRFLDDVYNSSEIKISIKTRIGMQDEKEFYDIINIYNKYPVSELIIHPRLREDFYNGNPNLDIFKDAVALSKCSVCYNGDIFTKEDYEKFTEKFGSIDKIMIGRGIIGNPGLISHIISDEKLNKNLLISFYNEVLNGYKEMMHDDLSVLYKMKQLLLYMVYLFPNSKKNIKAIKKSSRLKDLECVMENIFMNQEILDNPEIVWRN